MQIIGPCAATGGNRDGDAARVAVRGAVNFGTTGDLDYLHHLIGPARLDVAYRLTTPGV